MDVPPAAMACDADSGFKGWTAIGDERSRRRERSVGPEESNDDPQREQLVDGGGRILLIGRKPGESNRASRRTCRRGKGSAGRRDGRTRGGRSLLGRGSVEPNLIGHGAPLKTKV